MAPVMIVLKLLEWGCSLAQMMSGWIFRLLGIIMLLTAFGCWGFQLEEAKPEEQGRDLPFKREENREEQGG